MTTTISLQHKNDQHLETFSLIWLDSDCQDTRDTEQKLRSIINHFTKFQDLEQCEHYIQQTSSTDRLILIIKNQLGRQLIPSIHQLQQIISIYIYCINKELHRQDFSKYSKFKCVLTNADELISKITYDHRIRKQIEEPFTINIFSSHGNSTTKLNGQFVFFQVLIECLLKLKPTDEDKSELINLYQNEYQRNKTEFDILKEFQNTYSLENALWWYTRESFFYRTINSALRSENIHMMFLLRSYVFDIQQQLQKYQCKDHLTVYRSQIMSKNEFEIFKQSEGQLISVNSFFSSSKDRSSAIFILGETNPVVDWERILFEIDADPKMIKTKPFANISQLSYFPNESEILFMSGSIFRINKISYDQNQLWIVEMTLSNDDDYDLKDVLKDMKKQVEKGETNLRTLAKILWEIGELHLAERYLERLLNQISRDDLLHIDLYDDLARLTAQMKNPEKSMEWRQKLITFKENYPFAVSIRSLENSVKIPSNDLELYEEIGNGGFGKVYRAKRITDDVLVAVKQLHAVHLNKEAELAFLNELLLLSRVRHPHIVSFYGVCLKKKQCTLVMEYMSLGSLYQLLHKDKVTMPWSDRLSIALQAARGITYLHQYQPQILHRDIKSMNILLENYQGGYLVKVCDFGLAKTRNETTGQTKGNIEIGFTISWAAPEVLDFGPYSDRSDIYSLSIVYWELASNQIPYDGCQSDIIIQSVIAGRRLKIPDSTPLKFRIIIEKCWAPQPEERPICPDLLRVLNECIEEQRNDNNAPSTTTKQASSFTNSQRKVSKETNEQKSNLKWNPKAQTIVGGNGGGDQLNQLKWPHSIYVDDEQKSIYIVDSQNHRIVRWKFGAKNGEVVAGGNGKGDGINQLSFPTDMIVDRKTKDLIICDFGNRRVLRCSLENQLKRQIIISDIDCYGLMMNDNEDLFVSDCEKNEVRRWKKGEKEGTVVAGANGRGNRLNQLNYASHIFIDHNDTVYVSDRNNHRVMKWAKDAEEGIAVAGGQGEGNGFKQLSSPKGVIVNEVGDVYVADSSNNRIMCWPSGSKEGRIVVGGNGQGQRANQLDSPQGLSFDVDNKLYVVDWGNSRIQRFDVQGTNSTMTSSEFCVLM